MIVGLLDKDMALIYQAVSQYSEIREAVIFGSRAKDTFSKGSDVDLAIKGKQIDDTTVKRLSARLNEELSLPYFFDVVHYETIQNAELQKHIDRVGIVIYPARHE